MAKNPTTTAVATVESENTIRLRDAVRSMIAVDDDGSGIAAAVLDAKTVDEILGEDRDGATGLSEIIGTPFTINRIELRASDHDAGLDGYAVMFSTFDDGTTTVITCGAQKVVAQCIALHTGGYLPKRVSSRKTSKPTKGGFYPVELVKAPEQLVMPTVKDDHSQF